MRGWKKAAAVWSLFILLWVHPADAFGSEADLGRRETFDSVGALIREEEDMQTEGELFSQMPDLGLEKIQTVLDAFSHIKMTVIKMNLPVFQAGHLQYIVDQAQKMPAG